MTVRHIDEEPQLAYFVFLLETAQTALTAADLHYWFIQGFGDVDRLKDSHYAPIDIAIMHSVISLIVQEYFCYRIWTLNKRLSWLCVVIAIVRSFPILFPRKSRYDLIWIQIGVIQSIGAAWGGIMVSISALFLVVHF